MKSQGHNKKAAKALNRMHKAKITELNLIPNSIHDNNKHHVWYGKGRATDSEILLFFYVFQW